MEVENLPKITYPKVNNATDFSYLFPSVPPETWDLIYARITNFGDETARQALVIFLCNYLLINIEINEINL